VLRIEATATLRQAGTITGWRDELYPVTHAFDAPPAALIERAAAPYFGVKVVQTCSEEERVPSSVTFVEHIARFQASSWMTRWMSCAGLWRAHQRVCARVRWSAAAVGCPQIPHQANLAVTAGPHCCRRPGVRSCIMMCCCLRCLLMLIDL
jgi:Domain of unknown function (DUF4743)